MEMILEFSIGSEHLEIVKRVLPRCERTDERAVRLGGRDSTSEFTVNEGRVYLTRTRCRRKRFRLQERANGKSNGRKEHVAFDLHAVRSE